MELFLFIWLCGLLYRRNKRKWLDGTITEREYLDLCNKHGKPLPLGRLDDV